MAEAVKVAGGLVYRVENGVIKVVVVDDRFGYVTLPKGHMEDGEILEETALREIKEETGLQGRVVSPIQKISYSFLGKDGKSIHKDAYYYLIEALGGELQAQVEEVDEVRLVSLDEAEKLVREQGYPNNLEAFLRGFAMLRKLANAVYPSLIDHTLLAPVATSSQVELLCREARAYRFASVCVNPLFVRDCAAHLAGSSVKVCTVIGFPLGATTSAAKVAEAKQALQDGAEELDMVIAIGKLKEGATSYVEEDIRAVVEAAGDQAIVKVILETGLLTEQEQEAASACAMRAGAHFVKTSTGFAGSGATVEAVRLMRSVVGDRLGVKASGGVRTPKDATDMIQAGANRLGTSSGPRLVVAEDALGW